MNQQLIQQIQNLKQEFTYEQNFLRQEIENQNQWIKQMKEDLEEIQRKEKNYYQSPPPENQIQPNQIIQLNPPKLPPTIFDNNQSQPQQEINISPRSPTRVIPNQNYFSPKPIKMKSILTPIKSLSYSSPLSNSNNIEKPASTPAPFPQISSPIIMPNKNIMIDTQSTPLECESKFCAVIKGDITPSSAVALEEVDLCDIPDCTFEKKSGDTLDEFIKKKGKWSGKYNNY